MVLPMLKNIKAQIRTIYDDLRDKCAGLVTIVYEQEEMDRMKKAHGIEHMTDAQAAQFVFDDLLRDRRSSPRNKNSYEKERSGI